MLNRCPDGALDHGPPDGAGRCPWCRNQVNSPAPKPPNVPRSELSEAYGYYYDPDEGTRGPEELRRQLLSGTAYYG